MIKLEKYRIEEIGKLFIEAVRLPLNEDQQQKLFFEIASTIRLFGLYETCEKILQGKIEEYRR
jgi:hypothetical protein